MERKGEVLIDSWAGRSRVAVVVFGETRTKYHCRLVADAHLPGHNNHQKAGREFLAPKQSVRFTAS